MTENVGKFGTTYADSLILFGFITLFFTKLRGFKDKYGSSE
jgi:hypothetical protein